MSREFPIAAKGRWIWFTRPAEGVQRILARGEWSTGIPRPPEHGFPAEETPRSRCTAIRSVKWQVPGGDSSWKMEAKTMEGVHRFRAAYKTPAPG